MPTQVCAHAPGSACAPHHDERPCESRPCLPHRRPGEMSPTLVLHATQSRGTIHVGGCFYRPSSSTRQRRCKPAAPMAVTLTAPHYCYRGTVAGPACAPPPPPQAGIADTCAVSAPLCRRWFSCARKPALPTSGSAAGAPCAGLCATSVALKNSNPQPSSSGQGPTGACSRDAQDAGRRL